MAEASDEGEALVAAEAPAPAVPANPKADAVNALIESWFATSIHNSPLSIDTVHYNRLFETKEALKQQIAAALS